MSRIRTIVFAAATVASLLAVAIVGSAPHMLP